MNEKINHKVIGFERIEVVENKISEEESIARIINSVIKTKIEKYSVSINLKDGIEIGISSEEDMSIVLNSEIDIRDNFLIIAIAKLAKNAVIIINKYGNVIEKKLNFNNLNHDYIEEQIETYNNKNMTNYNQVIFRISKRDLRKNISDFFNKGYNVTKLKSYLNEIYNNGLLKGFKIDVYDNNSKESKLECNEQKGLLVNKDSYKINNKRFIKIFRDEVKKRRVEIWVNNVKVDNKYLYSLINWNKEPFKKNGYSFKRLFIEVSVFKENFNINHEIEISKLSTDLYKEVVKKVAQNIKFFESDVININLKYEKENMKEIFRRTDKNSATEATKMVLDKFLEEK
jgi:hypothetical protein